MSRCYGVTKKFKRCKRDTPRIYWPFCDDHKYQFINYIFIFITAVATIFTLTGTNIHNIIDWYIKNNENNLPIQIKIERNRKIVPSYIENETILPIENEKPDLLTLIRNNKILSSFEIYQKGNTSSLNEYPFTTLLYQEYIPTEIKELYEGDINKDGKIEYIFQVTNKLYGVHYDTLKSILIINSEGQLIDSALTPRAKELNSLNITNQNPYSAYNITGVMKNNINQQYYAINFTNDFTIIKRNNEIVLQYAWVIDNAPYYSENGRLFQIEEFKLNNNRLISEGSPMLLHSNSWEVKDGNVITIPEAKEFLDANNQPSFQELINFYKSNL